MFVGALCHDLDHRGFNNKFMIDIGSPLAAIYSTSTMEHHHFNMTVALLQHDSCNILGGLGPEEYKQVLGNMKHCILATDLALFFPNKAKLAQLQVDESASQSPSCDDCSCRRRTVSTGRRWSTGWCCRPWS